MQDNKLRKRTDRVTVGCYYCGKDLQLDNLADHIKRKHGADLPVKKRGDPPSIASFYQPQNKVGDPRISTNNIIIASVI